MAKYIKPTLKTKYHIDFNWWQKPGKNFHRYLMGHACEDVRALVAENPEVQVMDWVDPETGQVFIIDQLWHHLQTDCVPSPEFIPETLALTESIVRLFIANDNTPLTPVEIAQALGGKKDARTILRTIGGKRIYEGIRPVVPPV